MDIAANRIFARAQDNVPRVTNALANSGKVTKDDSGDRIRRVISYGTSLRNPRTGTRTSSYAVYKHEVPRAGHMKGYKWLEKAMLAYGREEFMSELASRLREGL
jgi:hypothetical protein